jgi:hypothetical protein
MFGISQCRKARIRVRGTAGILNSGNRKRAGTGGGPEIEGAPTQGIGGVNWSMQHLLIELYREVFDDIGTDVGFVGAPER